MVVHDGQVAVEVRHGKAVDHRERHPGRACEPGRGLPGPDLSQRLLAHRAGARAGRAVLAAPRIPDPLSRGGGEDGDRIPRRGEDVRWGQPHPSGPVRQERPQAVGDAAPSGPPSCHRPGGGGRDRGGAGVPAGVHRRHRRGPRRGWRAALLLG